MVQAIKALKCLKLFVFALLFLPNTFNTSYAADVVNLGVQQGLSQSSVGDIIQGPDGFMWFATSDGLARYDGSRFKTYYAPSDTQQLEKRFTQLFLSSDGILFARSEKQLFYYDVSLDALRPVLQAANQQPIMLHQIRSAVFWQNTFFALENGKNSQLSVISLSGSQVTQWHKVSLTESLKVDALLVNPKGDLYVASQTAFAWVSTIDGQVKDITPSHTAPYFVFERLHSGDLTFLDDSVRWCLNGPSLVNCGKHNFDFAAAHYPSTSWEPILIEPYDAKKRLFVSFDKALYLLDENYAVLSEFSSKQGVKNYLPNNSINSVYVDNQKNIWVSTYGAGVNLIASEPNLITTFSKNDEKQSLTHNHVRSFWEDTKAGMLWIGTFDGLNRLDLSTQDVTQFMPPFDTAGSFFIRGILGYRERLIIMLNKPFQGSMFWLFDPVTSDWEALEQPTGLTKKDGAFISFVQQNKLWVSFVNSGLYYYDVVEKNWHRADFWGDGKHPLYMQSLYIDENDNFYIGSTSGAYFYHSSTKQFLPFIDNASRLLRTQWVRSFLQAEDGTVWVGTNSGLNRIEVSESGIKVVDTYFHTDTIYGIVEDAKQRLWLSTNDGLIAFSPSTDEVARFKQSDGLQSNEFNSGAYLQLNNGSIVFGGVGGMSILNPDELLNFEPPQLPLHVIGLHVLNENISYTSNVDGVTLDAPLTHLSHLSVRQNLPAFSIDLALLQYRAKRNITYEYKISELSDVWLSLSGQRAYFTGLPTGKFNVSFRALSPNGTEIGRKSILLSVVPPLWRSGPAITVYLVVALFIIFALYRRRVSFHKQQTLRLQRAVTERTKELNNALAQKNSIFNHISHEFRTPLTLINGLVREAQEAPQNTESSKALLGIKRQGNRLLTLVNQLLALNTQQSADTPNVPCEVNYVIQPVIDVFQIMARQRGLELKASVEQGVWCKASAADIETIVNNLLSNAIKYSSSPKNEQKPAVIYLKAYKSGQNVILQVQDAGSGIPETELIKIWQPFFRSHQHQHIEGTGLGLPLVKSLTEKHHGTINAFNIQGQGACFECTLPTVEPREEQWVADSEIRAGIECEISLGKFDLTTANLTNSSNQAFVLIVEDNQELSAYLLRTLSRHYNCSLAKDGLEALEALAQHQPDIIVSDVMMPNMDGFALCQAIKNEPATSHIPVILLTAKGDYESRIEGLSHKANVYLSKPFEADELLLHIRNLTEQLEQLKQYYQQGFKQEIGIDSSLQVSERAFSEKLNTILDTHYASVCFDPPALANAMALSERQLQRKLKALADCTPSQFIRTRRLEKSKLMLLSGAPIGNVAFDCGFSSQAYFSKCFREAFHVTPTQFIESNSENIL